MSWNMPAGCSENDLYFTQEDDDFCEHETPTCAACEEEDARAKAAEEEMEIHRGNM